MSKISTVWEPDLAKAVYFYLSGAEPISNEQIELAKEAISESLSGPAQII